MALKTQDYYMLVELRKNLFTMLEMRKQSAKGREKLNHLRATLSDIQNTNKYMADEPEYSLHEKGARAEFTKAHLEKVNPINRKFQEKHQRKLKGIKAVLGFLFTVITLAGIAGMIFLAIYLWDKTKLGYGFFVANQWVGLDAVAPAWSGSIHIYCFILGALAAMMFAAAIITALADGEIVTPFTVFGIIMMIVVLVAGFLFIGQWWNVSIGWWILAWIPAVLVATFLPIIFVVKIVYATVVVFVMLALFAVIPVLCWLLWHYFNSIAKAFCPKMKYVSERIDVDEFQKTEAYRKAVALDKKEDAIRKKEHQQKIGIVRNVLSTQYKTLIKAEEQVISNFDATAKICEKAIANCPINATYKTIENVNWLLYYFEFDLAKTVQEAANLMRNDIKMKQLQDLLRQQHREVMGGLQQIHSQLNQIERTNQALLTQWKAIEKQSERQHAETMNQLQHMEEQQERLSNYSLQAIRDAESSMARNISDMQSAYVNQSYASANKIAAEINAASMSISSSISALGKVQ